LIKGKLYSCISNNLGSVTQKVFEAKLDEAKACYPTWDAVETECAGRTLSDGELAVLLIQARNKWFKDWFGQ